MKVIDPYATLQAHYDTAVAGALQSNAAEYIRSQILAHLIDLHDDTSGTQFARGARMGLRLAFLAAGGQVDGDEQSWDDLVEENRRG